MGDPNRSQITVTTGSRLHFGLMRTGPPFGGLGVMIDQPQNVITINASNDWHCDPLHDDRIMPIARRVTKLIGSHQLPRCSVKIQQGVLSHCGLGSGTQISLAVAEGLCQFCGIELTPIEIATTIANRGKRSAVGVHGYFHGGLIFESPASRGQQNRESINYVSQRVELPRTWRLVFLLPPKIDQSISGQDEAESFARLGKEQPHQTKELTRTIENQIMPAVASSNFAAFCDAVSQYNHQSGLLFAEVQGGAYNGSDVTSLIQTLQNQGLRGIGQSSWGPGVFAWFNSQKSLDLFRQQLPAELYRMMATAQIKNSGRELVNLRRD